MIYPKSNNKTSVLRLISPVLIICLVIAFSFSEYQESKENLRVDELMRRAAGETLPPQNNMSLEYANQLNSQGVEFYSQNKYPEGLEVLLKSLEVRGGILGEHHLDMTITLSNIGNTYDSMGNYPNALKFHNKALLIKEKKLGKAHPSTADSYNSIGNIYHAMSHSLKALEFNNKALAIREKALGKEHSKTADSYNSIAEIYHFMSDYPSALKLHNKALVIKDKVLGKEHPSTANSYNNIGTTYHSMGDYPRALEFHNKSLVIKAKALGEDHPDTGISYNNIANVYHFMGDYPRALEFHNRSVAIKIKSLGGEHPNVATSYSNMGEVFRLMGDYPSALEFHNKSLLIKLKKFSKYNPTISNSYSNLGMTYQSIGDFPKALEKYNKALLIREKAFGKDHPDTAVSYSNIGGVYQYMSIYPKALEFQNRALSVLEKVLGMEHPHTAQVYNNLGLTYNFIEDYSKALFFLNKAVLVNEKILGKNHPETAKNYHNIGGVYDFMGDYHRALDFYKKSVIIRKKVLGESHPETAQSYNNIGLSYHYLKDYYNAQMFHNKALVINEKILGKDHPSTAKSYLNISGTYGYLGDHSKSYQFAKIAFTNFLNNRKNNFSVLSTQQKTLFLKSNENYIDFLLASSFHYFVDLIKSNKSQSVAVTLKQTTTNDWLAYKGSVLDSENRLLQLAKTSKNPSVKESYTALVAAKRLYGQLSQSLPESADKVEQWNAKLTAQTDKIAQLEQTIIKLDPRFKDEKDLQVVNTQEIAKSLGSDSLYIDFAKTNAGYYLFTIDHQNTTSFNAYNPADSAAIDEAIIAFQTKMGAISSDQKLINQADDTTKQTLGKLYKLLFTKELLAKLTDKISLIISPDGALRLLPFEALFNEADNEYLIESTDIRYITSGKELVRLLRQNKDQTSNQNKAVLFANPDFGGKPSKQSADARGSDQIVTPNTHESRTLTLLESLQPNFKSLPGTQKEVDAIAKEIPHDAIKKGNDANEAYLLEVKQPNILHLATHGFFLKDIPNPMLKSGLILAGANESLKHNSGDGIVTALDLSGLDLQGTDLVVLSACETGKVDPNNTDGISGLSKAFIQAGAKDVVMSLWSVADDETAALMTEFYKAAKEDRKYAKALKDSKLKLLDQGMHPFYWAAFVLSGL